MLPRDDQADLLRACLLSGEAARGAFARWNARGEDPRRALATTVEGGRLLASLLHQAVKNGNWNIDASLLTHLRVATDHEQRRAQAYRGVVLEASEAFSAAGVPWLALKGAAYASTVYPDESLRHSHDIDVLVPPEALHGAAVALRNAGFICPEGSRPILDVHRTWIHRNGLPVQLHRWAFRSRGYGESMDYAGMRRTEMTVGGQRIGILGPEDAFVHSIVHASTGAHRANLVWVADAFFLAGAVRDWDRVVAMAEQSVFALPVAAGVRFLRDVLDCAVPEDVLDRVDFIAARATRAQREIVFNGLLPDRLGVLRSARPGAERRMVLRWIVAPLPTTVAQLTGRSGLSVASWYLERPIRWIWRRVAQ
jgi:hypothetical protein